MSLARLNMSGIDLSHNRFVGDASMLFGSTEVTASIGLSWNMSAFDLGKVELPKILSMLDVSHNRIYGNLHGSRKCIVAERELQQVVR